MDLVRSGWSTFKYSNISKSASTPVLQRNVHCVPKWHLGVLAWPVAAPLLH